MPNTSPTYFHGSYDPLDLNLTLAPQENGYVVNADSELEDLFERCRPEGAISRREAVFLVSAIEDIDPSGGYTDHIYEVQPAGTVEMHDLAWYTEAQTKLSKEEPEAAEECARAYWAGELHPVREWSLLEYLATSAVVIREVEEEIPSVPMM